MVMPIKGHVHSISRWLSARKRRTFRRSWEVRAKSSATFWVSCSRLAMRRSLSSSSRPARSNCLRRFLTCPRRVALQRPYTLCQSYGGRSTTKSNWTRLLEASDGPSGAWAAMRVLRRTAGGASASAGSRDQHSRSHTAHDGRQKGRIPSSSVAIGLRDRFLPRRMLYGSTRAVAEVCLSVFGRAAELESCDAIGIVRMICVHGLALS